MAKAFIQMIKRLLPHMHLVIFQELVLISPLLYLSNNVQLICKEGTLSLLLFSESI